MRLTLDGKNEYGALPENRVLNAEITKCGIQEKPWIDQKTGEPAKRLTFEFTMLDDEFTGRKHWEDLFTSFYPDEKCTLYVWVLKILGRDELPEGFTLDTDALVGTKVPIMLSTRHFKKKDGTPGSALTAEILSETEAASMRAAQAGSQVKQHGPEDFTINSEVKKETSTTREDDLVEPFSGAVRHAE